MTDPACPFGHAAPARRRAILPPVILARRAGPALLAALACRPQAPAPAPEPRIPFYAVTPERLYTTAPVGDGISHVAVAEKSLERRAGRVDVSLAYPDVDLPDNDRRRELAAAIREAAQLDAWAAADGEDLVGAVKVACTAPLATTAIVSLECERLDTTISIADARAGRGAAPAGPTIVARTYAVSDGPVRPLGWRDLLRPGVAPEAALAAALLGADAAVHGAWLSGQCAAGEPGLALRPTGLAIWPDVLAPPCDRLELKLADLERLIVPTGTVARALRLVSGGDAPPPDAPPADPPTSPAVP